MEKPSYLGAFQAFDQYCPEYYPVTLNDDGLDIEELEETLEKYGDKIKLAYLIPEFQNPPGLEENRAKVTEILKRYNVVLIEDDPYGQLRFEGTKPPYIGLGKLPQAALLGTFSKVATPGMRVGYVVTENKELAKYIAMALEATSLHTNIFSQYLLLDYLQNNDQPAHVKDIQDLYRQQCHCMLDAMDKYFPENVTYTRPEGGMFIWATLPEGVSAIKLFPKAAEKAFTMPTPCASTSPMLHRKPSTKAFTSWATCSRKSAPENKPNIFIKIHSYMQRRPTRKGRSFLHEDYFSGTL